MNEFDYSTHRHGTWYLMRWSYKALLDAKLELVTGSKWRQSDIQQVSSTSFFSSDGRKKHFKKECFNCNLLNAYNSLTKLSWP